MCDIPGEGIIRNVIILLASYCLVACLPYRLYTISSMILDGVMIPYKHFRSFTHYTLK